MTGCSMLGCSLRFNVAILVSCISVTMGCKPKAAPKAPLAAAAVPVAERIVTALPEPAFDYFKGVDRKVLEQRLEDASKPFVLQPKPEGMTEEVYDLCKLVLSGEAEARKGSLLTVEQTGRVADARFTSNDKYFVTLGDSLAVWRLEDGVCMRKHEVPIKNAKQLLIGDDITSAALVSPTEIANVSLVDGKITAVRAIPEGILFAAKAAVAGHVAICTSQKNLCLISSDLQSRIDCPDVSLSTQWIAVHPSGKWVLGNHEQGMLRWHVKPSEVEFLGNKNYSAATALPFSGSRFDRWIDSYTVHEFEGDQRTPVILEEPGMPFVITPPVVVAFQCSNDMVSDWLLVMASNHKPEHRAGVYTFDIFPSLESASRPLELSRELPPAIYASPRGTWLALQSAGGLQLTWRRPWVAHTGTATTRMFLCLAVDGRFDQLDQVFDYLRGHTRFPSGVTGEQAASQLAAVMGDCWKYWTTRRECAKQLEAAEKWLEAGSTLAIVASASRHLSIGGEARGEGFAGTVTEEGWRIFAERCALATADLARLDLSQDQPATAYHALMTSALHTGDSRDAADVLLKKAAELYPLDLDSHLMACLWSLPRWGGEDRQVGAYIAAWSDLFPRELSDEMYARLVVWACQSFVEVGNEQFGFDFDRARLGLESWLAKDVMMIEDVEAALYMANIHLQDSTLTERLADYHLARFNLPKRRAYYGNVIHQLLASRIRLFGNGE